MKKKEVTKHKSLDEVEFIYTSFPTTHVFYEYQGERAVDPHRLVMDGFTLWREQAENNAEHRREVLRLWNEAETLLAKRHETPTHSYVEWLRYQITMGSMDPKKWQGWKKKKPYPYRGMLISAIYLQEAMALCEKGNTDRVWHIVAMAYYYLGMSTTPSSTQLTARAAKTKYKEATEMRRALALVPLEIIKQQQEKKRTIKDVEGAIAEVIQMIYRNPGALAELKHLDTLQPTRTGDDNESDALDRFSNLLVKWASPGSPHPDIAEAFAFFGQKKYTPRSENIGPTVPAAPAEPGVSHYMRLVNMFESGHVLTLEISRREEDQ